jgi:hypothetical protein
MSAGRASLKLISKFWNLISSDRRPDCEKTRERNFITAANKLKTILLNAGGGFYTLIGAVGAWNAEL